MAMRNPATRSMMSSTFGSASTHAVSMWKKQTKKAHRMQKGRRKLRNLLIFPESQVRYGLLFLSLATFTHVGLTIVVIKLYSSWLTSEGDVSGAVPVWMLALGLAALYLLLQAFAFTL